MRFPFFSSRPLSQRTRHPSMSFCFIVHGPPPPFCLSFPPPPLSVPLVWYYVAVPLPFGQAVLFHVRICCPPGPQACCCVWLLRSRCMMPLHVPPSVLHALHVLHVLAWTAACAAKCSACVACFACACMQCCKCCQVGCVCSISCMCLHMLLHVVADAAACAAQHPLQDTLIHLASTGSTHPGCHPCLPLLCPLPHQVLSTVLYNRTLKRLFHNCKPPFPPPCSLPPPSLPHQILSTVLYNRTLVVHACTRVFTLPGDEALLRGAWRAITLLVGISSPMQGGLLAPSFGPDEDLQLDDDGSLSGLGFGGSSPARCGNATNEWPSLASGGVTGGVTSDQGSCPAAVSHGQVCVATMTFAQVVLGLWLPFVLSYVMLLRMRRRLLKDHMLDWESEQEVALQLQRRRQQQLAYAAAAAAAGTPVGPAGAWEGGAGVGGGGGGDGGGAGSWLAMALESCHVSPLALLLFTVAVSNMTYWAVVGAWSL